MSEFEEPAIAVMQQYRCDKCKLGRLTFVRKTTIQPASFLHKCNNCGDEMLLRKQYPSVQFRSIQEAKNRANQRLDERARPPVSAPVRDA